MSTSTRLSELLLRWQELRRQGQTLAAEELCADCPQLADDLRQQIQALESMESLIGMGAGGRDSTPMTDVRFARAPGAPSRPGDQPALDPMVVPGYEILAVL